MIRNGLSTTGTGKTHLATAIGAADIQYHAPLPT